MYCCFCGYKLEDSFVYCPSCGRKKSETSGANAEIDRSASTSSTNNQFTSGTPSIAATFADFKKRKEIERQSHFKPNKRNRQAEGTRSKSKDEVIINVGLMEYEYGEAKVQRGKSFPVKLTKDMSYDEVRERSVKKWEDYDRSFSRDRGYVLVFPDGKIAKKIPGCCEEFTLRKYKEGLAKSYSRITLYLCPATEKKETSMLPITNWLSDEENEIRAIERAMGCDSDDDWIDCNNVPSSNNVIGKSSENVDEPSINLNKAECNHSVPLFEVADFL